MTNTFWEEKILPKSVNDMHARLTDEIDYPLWVKSIKCPFCKAELPSQCIREISFKFNARNIGDISVEVFCERCNKMDHVYIPKQFDNMRDIIALIDGSKTVTASPILQKDMYALQYNNAIEKTINMYNKEKVNGDDKKSNL